MNSGRAMKPNNFQFSFFNFQSIIALCVIMVTSCVNDIPYNAELGAPKLVLNALLQPDSILTATVSRTSHFLDIEEPQRLPDATVTAMINGTAHSLNYSTATQDYRSNYRLCPGDEVTLTATHTIGTATATEWVMPPHAITIVRTAMQPFTIPGDPLSLATLNEVDSALMVSLHIDDPADESNYYRLTIDYKGDYLASVPNSILYAKTHRSTPRDNDENAKSDTLIKESFYPHYLLTESSSRLVTESESTAQILGGIIYLTSGISITFSDKHLRGTDGQPIIDFLMLMEYPRGSNSSMYDPENGWTGDDMWDDTPKDDSFIFPADTVSSATYHCHFTLETLSEDYYQYLNDAASYQMMGGMGVGEPTPIHSNIDGGLGILGSYGSAACSTETTYKFRTAQAKNYSYTPELCKE